MFSTRTELMQSSPIPEQYSQEDVILYTSQVAIDALVMGRDHWKNEAANQEYAATGWEYQATHDPLTGVLNVLGGNMILEQFAKEGKNPLVIYLDGKNIKKVNDEGGHNLGDTAIKIIANSPIRKTDYIIRIGGDEFIILVDPTFRDPNLPHDTPEHLAEQIRARIQKHAEDSLEENPELVAHGFGISTGAAVAREGSTFESLKVAAEAEMLLHKQEQGATLGNYR